MTSLVPRSLGNNSLFLDPLNAIREFERMFALNTQPSYPPYNLVKASDSEFILEFALAGFTKKDINVSVDNGRLVIAGEQVEQTNDSTHYIHRGIGMRKFTRTFQLPENVVVDGAKMEDGILRVSMTRIVPEEKKPKQITIK